MAKKSIAYQKMRDALYAMIEEIPHGKIMELPALALALNIPPRHAAFMISQMTNDEKDLLPWHRVVPRKGMFPTSEKRSSRHEAQIALLAGEAIIVSDTGQMPGFDDNVVDPPTTHASKIWGDQQGL